MKKLLILSGKGGTGKTTLAGAFIRLSSARRYADCDVDAPNLHLVLSQEMEPVIQDFYGLVCWRRRFQKQKIKWRIVIT